MAIDPLDLMLDTGCEGSTIDESIVRTEAVFVHPRPYEAEPMVGGDLYKFTDEFIEKVRYALSTDSLAGFSADELELWKRLTTLESMPEGYMSTDQERPELALDNLLLALVNCEDTLTLPNTETTVDVYPCTI